MTATETPETGLMPYAAGQVEEYRARIVMTPDDAKALDAQLRACTLAVLREGVDYGTIPGTDDRKVLFKPGAEKLLQWFGLAFTCDRTETEYDGEGRKEGVTYRATVTRQLPGGRVVVVATCEGYAGYDEAKFFKTAEEVQRKAEESERYFAHKDRRPPRPTRWEGLPEYRAPWNTIIKMAQKRALVGATVDATAAAGLFSAEDGDEDPAAPPDDGPSLAARLLDEAAAFTTEAAAGDIWREAATAAREGLCTPGQATHIQNRVRVRLKSLQQAAQPVHVGDLARQAAQDASPADSETTPPSPAGEAPDPGPAVPDETPGSGPAAGPGPTHAGSSSAGRSRPQQETSPSSPSSPDSSGAAPDEADYDTPGTITGPMITGIWTVLNTVFSFTKDEKDQARAVCSHITGRELTSTKDMSRNEATNVLDVLSGWRAKADAQDIPPRDYLVGVMAAEAEADDA